MKLNLSVTDGVMRQRSEDKYGQLILVPEIRFAHTAAFRLLEPSPPLVTIYGPAGSGKTHLVRCFLREHARAFPDARTMATAADEFSAELARASQAQSVPEFQESHRNCDLFVCEDLQVLEGRRKTQGQLLAIIDELMARGSRALLTSTKPPGGLSQFSSKLKNRCQGGVCAAIEVPGRESREKLLAHFAVERGLSLPDDVASRLARELSVSSRELQGVISHLELLARQNRRAVDQKLAEAVIAEMVVAARPTMNQITKTVARAFSIKPADLKSETRTQGLVLPRQLAMFAAREWAEHAYSEIGKHFGRRSHSTIVHACQRIRSKLASDPDFQRLVEMLQEQLNLPQRTWSHNSTT